MGGVLRRSFCVLLLCFSAGSGFAQTEASPTQEQTWQQLNASLRTLEQQVATWQQLWETSRQSSPEQAQRLADSLTEIQSLKESIERERERTQREQQLLEASRADYVTLNSRYENAMQRISNLESLAATLQRHLEKASDSADSSARNLATLTVTLLWWKIGGIAAAIWAAIATILAVVK